MLLPCLSSAVVSCCLLIVCIYKLLFLNNCFSVLSHKLLLSTFDIVQHRELIFRAIALYIRVIIKSSTLQHLCPFLYYAVETKIDTSYSKPRSASQGLTHSTTKVTRSVILSLSTSSGCPIHNAQSQIHRNKARLCFGFTPTSSLRV